MCTRVSIRRRCHRGTVSLPFYRWHVTAGRRVSGYPERLDSLGDHVCRARLDRKLNRKIAAAELRIDPDSLRNWEKHRTEIEVQFYPRIIGWLGYDPLPRPETRWQHVLTERLRRGWSRKRLAREAGVDEATVRRIENNTPRLARRPAQAVYQTLGLESIRAM
jgi:ribosome-binding protein aMBF1 (putative translation factor)